MLLSLWFLGCQTRPIQANLVRLNGWLNNNICKESVWSTVDTVCTQKKTMSNVMEVQLKEVKGKQLEALVYSSPVKFVLLPFFPPFSHT